MGTTGRGCDPARRRRRQALAAAVAVALACLIAGGAFTSKALAIYGPSSGGFGADIVSVDNASDEQANAPTNDAAISGNGRYVVFQTRATNFFEDDGVVGGDREPAGACRQGGIFRYDRDTGQIALVADGTEIGLNAKGECDPSKVLVSGAAAPSVSEDGRYVVFATAQRLVPQDENDNIDVYVRDMDVPLTANRAQSGAYTLVSAQNGTEDPAVYDESSLPSPIPGGNPGSEVWPNTSISADGRYVAFRSAELPSSLPAGSSPTTPPDQLFVRDLQDKTTTLVTHTMSGEEPAGGANGPASISADGSTVAWLGSDAPSQTVFLPGETIDSSIPYYMWRRWSESGAKTRRVTGIADPEDPECKLGEGVTQNPTTLGPCYGPLTYPESSLTGLSGVTPSLSADGYTVAFLAGSSIRPDLSKADALDLFLTSMKPGVTRKAGTSELTLAVNGADGNGNASITSLAMSADGTHIAFVSQRNDFVLPQPAPIGGFGQFGQENELYVVNLTADTLERAIVAAGDAEPNGSTLANPTISANGTSLAFASSSSNLIVGDANGVADAFVASLQQPLGTAPPPSGVNTVEGGFSISTSATPELGLHVKRGKTNQLVLLVETPEAGRIAVVAHGSIAVKVGRRTEKKRVVFVRASGVARSEGTTTILLTLPARYAKQLKRLGRLKAAILVGFRPASPEEALSAETSSLFVSPSAKKAGGSGSTTRRVKK